MQASRLAVFNKKSVIVRLSGGLGNQIFQLSAGIMLARKSQISHIIIDDSALNKYAVVRSNGLLSLFDFDKLDEKIVFSSKMITNFRLPKILPLHFARYPLVSDANFQIILHHPNRTWSLLDGYFQECLKQVDFDQAISFLKPLVKEQNFSMNDGCVIHIRGGDFVKLGWNSISPLQYYEHAIKKMQNDFGQERFFIVTDDVDYAQTLLDSVNIKYEYLGKNLEEDFWLIGRFRYRILSSSTFALWASALGNNQNSTVIASGSWRPGHVRKVYLPNELKAFYV